MTNSLISVIVPAYNAEKWIIDCCRSVFAQTWTNWELILVNDGSWDRTGEIADSIAQENINVRVIHTENRGVCAARNAGMDAARGEFITFLDADDMLTPDALDWLHSLIQTYGCDIAVGWKTNVKSDGTELGCPYDRSGDVWEGSQALEQSLLDHPASYAVWGKLYRKSLTIDIRFVEGKRVHEDSFFLFQCFLKQPKVAVGDRCILRYRLSENSASRSAFSDKLFDILYFADRKQELVEDRYPAFQPLIRNMLVKAHMALLHNLCTTWDPKYLRAEKDSIRVVKENRSYFVSAIKADQIWFFIIVHGLYFPYKLLYCLRQASFPAGGPGKADGPGPQRL